MSWANIVQAEPARKDVPVLQAHLNAKSMAVVDTNALIAGLQLHTLAEQLVTVPEVLAELRDAKSRQALDALPCRLHTREPSEESLTAVTRFARATGELHSLSAVDLKVIALTHELELAAHGTARLRKSPAPPRPHAKRSARGTRLPGWGDTGGGWAELDALAVKEAAAAERGLQGVEGASRIAEAVQTLDLNGNAATYAGTTMSGPIGAEEPGASDSDDGSEPSAEGGSDGRAAEQRSGAADEGEWQMAARSAAAARRTRRKQMRWERRQAHAQAQVAEAESPAVEPGPADTAEEHQPTGAAELGGECEAGHQGYSSEDEAGSSSDEAHAGGSAEEGASARSESSVACVTGDFAMQNVLLQMGLRLVAPDGSRVRELRRWALRCSACLRVTKEVGRIFCPQCGNAALDKVEVVISEDGQEQFGVRKRHILRGTRFSLPKPAGGKNCRDPILREDVLLQRMPHLRAKPAEAADAFAPEYGAETWHQKGAAAPAHAQGAAAAMALWRRNPNERSHARTSRRKR